jgi:hypothetical protein
MQDDQARRISTHLNPRKNSPEQLETTEQQFQKILSTHFFGVA